MTYALFDDAGKFHAGRVMNESDASMQVELDSGKRVKVKSGHVLLRFEKPAPAELISSGQRMALEIDLDLAWEFAPEGDFGFADFAREFMIGKPSVNGVLISPQARTSINLRPEQLLPRTMP